MSFADEKKAIESRFKANYTTTPVKYEGVSFRRPDGPWVALTVLSGEGTRITLGTDRQLHRYSGVIVVQVFTAENEDTNQARKLADEIDVIFRDQNFSHGSSGLIRCRTPAVETVGSREGLYQLNVVIPYLRDKSF